MEEVAGITLGHPAAGLQSNILQANSHFEGDLS